MHANIFLILHGKFQCINSLDSKYKQTSKWNRFLFNWTYRTFAKVWRRFFKYRLWYFCSSPIEPCSACILGSKKLALLKFDCWLLLVVAHVSLVVDGIDFVRPAKNKKENSVGPISWNREQISNNNIQLRMQMEMEMELPLACFRLCFVRGDGELLVFGIWCSSLPPSLPLFRRAEMICCLRCCLCCSSCWLAIRIDRCVVANKCSFKLFVSYAINLIKSMKWFFSKAIWIEECKCP